MKNWITSLLPLALAACAQAGPTGGSTQPAATNAAPGFANTRWMGVVDASLDKRSTPWLEFVGEGRVSGFSGCNMISGAWRVEGGAIRLGPLAATKRGCMGPEGDLEKRVLAALNEQSRGTREGSKLVFTGPAGQRFEFVEAK